MNFFRKKSCSNCLEAVRCKTRQNVNQEIYRLGLTSPEHFKMSFKVYKAIAAHCPTFNFL